uniref:F-box domain-containing protein n=1 Tax=Aegilops tauschii TaxID=37682 RepID=N1R1H5_AEGTA
MDEDRARRHCTPSEVGGGGADLISALPTDLLLQVLVRLGCTRAAARTSILSRRWRGLWTRLPGLTFRDVAPGPLLAALSSLGPSGVPLSLLDIHIPEAQVKVHVDRGPTWAGGRARRQSYRLQPYLHPSNQVSMLLRAAGRLSPAAFRFSHPHELENSYVDVDLSSCFRRATSIELDARFICFPNPQSEFPTLESLSISGCLVHLAVVVPLCPRLRVLRVHRAYLQGEVITVRSASLQEFSVENDIAGASTRRVDVEAPTLKQLTVFFRNSGDLSVSVLAPNVENVSWRCFYSSVRVGLGLWGLSGVRLQTKEGNNGQGVLPPVHILCLHMIAMQYQRDYRDAELAFAAEIEKHMFANFSGLELLGMHRFRTATRSLKVILQRFERKDGCPPDCPCDEPKNWRTQTISLTNLEKLDIIQFKGVDHEFDFLKLIFRCAPMLNKVTVELPKGFPTNDDWWTKIHNIFMAYPSVEGNVRTPGN